jgi:serine/threonine-protein kinase
VCAALAAAHAAGIIHRDVKPSNILIGPDGAVKVADFGIAKLVEADGPRLTATGQIIGSAMAMAPEQINCATIDQRTDVYALGALAFRLLTGNNVFDGDHLQVTAQHLEEPAPAPSKLAPVSPALDRVVLRCLEKSPAARFQTVTEVAEAFHAAVLGTQTDGGGQPSLAVLVRSIPRGDDDDALDAGVAAIDTAEFDLRAAGFRIALVNTAEVLGVRDEIDPVARGAAIALAHRLAARLAAERPAARTAVVVHVDRLDHDGSGAVVGGPLLDVDVWGDVAEGVVITPKAGG